MESNLFNITTTQSAIVQNTTHSDRYPDITKSIELNHTLIFIIVLLCIIFIFGLFAHYVYNKNSFNPIVTNSNDIKETDDTIFLTDHCYITEDQVLGHMSNDVNNASSTYDDVSLENQDFDPILCHINEENDLVTPDNMCDGITCFYNNQ